MPYNLDARGLIQAQEETNTINIGQGFTHTGPTASLNALSVASAVTFQGALNLTGNLTATGNLTIGGTLGVLGAVTASSTLNVAGALGALGTVTASGNLVIGNHLVGGGTAVNASNAAASSAIVAAGTFGTDLAGRVQFLSTAAGAGAQTIHIFSAAFATAPYVQVVGAGNASFQAGFPTVAASTNSFTMSLTLAPVVGASLAYVYQIHG